MDYKFINTEYLDSVSGGDKEIIGEIVQLFKEQASEIYAEMCSLLKAQDFISLGMLAHKAKSSVAIMGMTDLAAMLKIFELQAKESKEISQYESYILRYKNDTEAAIIELDKMLNNL